MTWFLQLIKQITHVDPRDPADRLRGELTALFLAATLCGGILLTLLNLIEYVTLPADRAEIGVYVLMDLVLLAATAGLWVLNRRGEVRLAAQLFILMMVLAALTLLEQNLFALVVLGFITPVFAASFILAPASSFSVAGIALGVYFLAGRVVFHQAPAMDVVSLVLLLAVALIGCVLSARLNRAMDSKTRLAAQLEQANRELALANDQILQALAGALHYRDLTTHEHSGEGIALADSLAERFGFSAGQRAALRRGALLHDIGKVGIPDAILHKPGPLTDSEWAIMRCHPQIAYDLLREIPSLQASLDIPYCHHERWDGAGYPRGLRGEEIPLAARIFAVVDVFTALSEDRPYRKKWPRPAILDFITSESGKQVDPQVVREFQGMLAAQENEGAGRRNWAPPRPADRCLDDALPAGLLGHAARAAALDTHPRQNSHPD